MLKKNYKFAIIGGGSWGTAIACLICRAIGSAIIYTNQQSVATDINEHHKNTSCLGQIELPDRLQATTNFNDVLQCETIIIATPSYNFETIIQKLKLADLDQSINLLIATKGLCQSPIQLFSQKLEQELTNSYGFISGPNFAQEIAQGKFAGITLACKDIALAKNIAKQIIGDKLDISVSDDVITAQIAGIVKNIIAIKSGILQAKADGENSQALLISKALQELSTISQALGGRIESVILPSVVGDLVLTSYSRTSRNTKFGFELHQNNYSKDFINNYPVLVEGVRSAKLLTEFVKNYNLELPVINSVAELFC